MTLVKKSVMQHNIILDCFGLFVLLQRYPAERNLNNIPDKFKMYIKSLIYKLIQK